MGTLEIVSESGEPFEDRVEAGRLLAERLRGLEGEVVVLGIPRGGVVVGRVLAEEMDAPLDIVLSRKLGAPGQPELAIGAVSEDGREFVDEALAARIGADHDYVEQEKVRVMQEIERRAERYRRLRPRIPLDGKTVIITDDGVATGATMQASLYAARRENPARLIAAVPVGSEYALRVICEYADRTLCLRAPTFFDAVGRFYRHFDQVGDEEVEAILRKEGRRTRAL